MFFDLDVTPDAEVEIVIDQNTGSSLKGTGSGLLLMEINTNIPTEVIIRLDGELENTVVDFDIEFPGTNSVVQSELEYRLQDPTIKSVIKSSTYRR